MKLFLIALTLPITLTAGVPKKPTENTNNESSAIVLSSSCAPASSFADLDINNVRAQIMNGGDLWWDVFGSTQPRYEIPKGSGQNSSFTAAIWIGGLDQGNQLKVASMTYRLSPGGNDFYPGPIDGFGTTSDTTCLAFDKIWKTSRVEVEKFVEGGYLPGFEPTSILTWPGNGPSQDLAPYFDKNGDNIYDPLSGDYPYYAINGSQNDCNKNLLGDQNLWWVFNDVGNAHQNTSSTPLGFEIHAQAFAYSTNNSNNNNTFYQYKIINRSSNTYHDLYFSFFNDADLGSCTDDYVGCDVRRGLGYIYNGDQTDDNLPNPCPLVLGYGSQPPAFGIDILNGALADLSDSIDNNHNGIIDEPNESITMSSFIYFDKSNTVYNGMPISANNYYNYMKGLWKDGTPMTYGKNGYNTGGVNCYFMFPDTSDTKGWGTNGILQPAWSEVTENNPPHDRQQLVSSGKFTMQPGQVQTITVGALWARTKTGDNLSSRLALQSVSDSAQAFFDNCFQITCNDITPSISYQATDLNVDFFTNTHGTYSWNFGDGKTSTLHHPTHTYTQAGTYTVNLFAQTTCGLKNTNTVVTIKDTQKPIISVILTRIEGQGNGGQNLDLLPEMYDSLFNSPYRILHPKYQSGHGPVYIELYDTTITPKGDFTFALNGVTNKAKWKMWRTGVGDTAYATDSIGASKEQYISKWGMKVNAKYLNDPGVAETMQNKNGYITSSITYSDPTKAWLSGVKDQNAYRANNWIRSGYEQCPLVNSQYYGNKMYCKIDRYRNFETVINGTWAPYRLCGYNNLGAKEFAQPAVNTGNIILSASSINSTSSIDLVLTADKSKWTRCPVLEAQENNSLAAGNALNLDLRKHNSVDKNGNVGDGIVTNDPNDADYIAATGMGWFPGFAVNVETGERLNMAFAEDSYDVTNNGNDMLWNPTSVIFSNDTNQTPLFGGKHYIYVFAHNGDEKWPLNDATLPNEYKSVPRYDQGSAIYKMLTDAAGVTTGAKAQKKNSVFADAMWVSIPLLANGHTLLETDAVVKLRVTKPYRKGYSGRWFSSTKSTPIVDTNQTPLNHNFPLYTFNTNFVSAVGIKQNILQNNTVLFYPNPMLNEATIHFNNPNQQVHQLIIYNMAGQAVKVYKNVVSNEIVIQNENLKPGMYFYALSTKEQKIATGKFVVE